MSQIKSTKGQRKKLHDNHTGTGFMMYNAGNGNIVELEFYIHKGEMRYITNDAIVEYQDIIYDKVE